jgi:hypothetical protein
MTEVHWFHMLCRAVPTNTACGRLLASMNMQDKPCWYPGSRVAIPAAKWSTVLHCRTFKACLAVSSPGPVGTLHVLP